MLHHSLPKFERIFRVRGLCCHICIASTLHITDDEARAEDSGWIATRHRRAGDRVHGTHTGEWGLWG